MIRSTVTTGFVLGALLWPASRIAPNHQKYKIDMKVESVIDLSGVGQGEQKNNKTLTGFIVVTLADTAGGRTMHIVLDSLHIDGPGAAMMGSVIDSAKGISYHAFVDPNGKISGLKASRGNLAAESFEVVLATFYPRTRPSMKKGEAWTDTLDTSASNSQRSTKTRTVTNYSAAGGESFGGVQANKIVAAFSSAISGTVETPAGPAELEGTANGSGNYYLSPDGRYLGGNNTTAGNQTIKIAMAPAPIPVKTSIAVTVTTTP